MANGAQRVTPPFVCQRWFLGCLGFALVALASLHVALPLQSGEPVPPQGVRLPEPSIEAVAAAAAAVAVHRPAGAPSIFLAGECLNIWEPPATRKVASTVDQAPVIDVDLLAGVEDKAEVRNAAESYNEAWAYSYLLVQANATPVKAFAKACAEI